MNDLKFENELSLRGGGGDSKPPPPPPDGD